MLVYFRQTGYNFFMSKAVFPGSFDPPTNGHLNIIQRASKMFEEVDVLIAVNEEKKYFFSQEERLNFLKELVSPYKNVSVHTWNGLVVDYAEQNHANVLIRGVRNVTDFGYEFDLSLMNYTLNSNIETIFMPTEQKFLLLKSSLIKELAKLGGDITGMVPEIVEKALKDKYSKNIV